jgi:LmbE family N-acetylglucosaminyl deacetylase
MTGMKKYFTCYILAISHVVFFMLGFSFASHAQAPPAHSSADIYLQIKKLNVLGSVLYIAAHPDDENTRLLAYLSKEKLFRTGYMSLTRGDGGQNLIGDEQGIELGLIRTQELLSARRIDGAEQFFSRAYDFGFSKSADEALKTWGHDKILSDVVWVIRKFQPDVIITRFPGDERAGHGHHQASEILAKEAFFAAADSTKFPEQFKYGVHPWQAKRILWNTFNFGGNNTTNENQFKMDVGGYNSLLGKSYGEIAGDSRSQHKSQGFGVARQRGQAFEYFETTAGDAPKNSLMDGVDTTWARAGNADISSTVGSILRAYNFEHPENSVAALVDLYQTIQKLSPQYWKEKKLQEIKNLIVECCGLFAEATTNSEYAIQGDKFNVQFFVDKRNNCDVVLKNIKMLSFDTSMNKILPDDENISVFKSFNVPLDAKISQPYWLEKPLQAGSFDVRDQQLIGKAENDPVYKATLTFSIDNVDFAVDLPVQYKSTDPVKGEVYQPLRVVPPITGSFDQPLYVLDGAKEKQIEYDLQTKKRFNEVSVHLTSQGNWKITGGNFDDSLKNGAAEDGKAIIATNIDAGSTEISVAPDKILDDQNKPYDQPLLDEHKISYEHIPPIIYYTPLKAKAEKINVVVKGKNIGYIVGAGDKVPQALEQMGYNVTYLHLNNITDENLKQFDAVIAGVRVYNVNDWMTSKYDVLMRYIQNGGNYIVQYNTSGFGPMKMKIGPYDFAITRTRVTDENAEVHVLLPDNPVLNYPNKITSKDFEGWIQERSIYHADQITDHYEAPIGIHDPTEPESNGSLIIAKYGKGNFVYTGLVFFRELPAGVPGAYRLMANLIALPKNK